MTTSTRQPGQSNILWFLVRALIPMVILGAALLGLTLAAGGDPTESSTLLVRIAGGALLSTAVFITVIALARRATAQTSLDDGVGRLRNAWRAFATGVALWLLPSIITFGTLALLGALRITVIAPATESLTVVLLVLGAVLFREAIPEELVFRGHLMSVLGERLQGWWMILVQAGIFTGFALALRGWTGTADFSLFVGMGIGLGYLRVVSGSVWTTVGFHTAFQTASQLILTHNVVAFEGSATAAMIALGAVPFAVGAILVSLLGPKCPSLFARQQ